MGHEPARGLHDRRATAARRARRTAS